MRIPFVDLKAQYQSLKTEIDGAIANVISDTAFISGKYARAFEAEFATWLGIEHCIACGNGTDAIEIMLQVMGVGAGDEVIVPACSWISTSETVSFVGAKPVFVDVDPLTYLIDPDKIEEKISAKTKAIIPVHLHGQAADMDRIMEIADRHQLLVLEDCAQAIGATWNGKAISTFGHAATFSFYPGKNLGAYGDAGCMVTNNEAWATQARMISNHGQLVKHAHQMEGRNSRLDGFQGAILSVKLPHVKTWTAARQAHAATYDRLLADSEIKTPTVNDKASHVYHVYVIEVPERAQVMEALKAAGIACAIHYPMPLPFLAPYADREPQAADYPAAYAAHTKILSLPLYPEMTEEMISYVVGTLLKAVNKSLANLH